jgi:hypothetical protein
MRCALYTQYGERRQSSMEVGSHPAEMFGFLPLSATALLPYWQSSHTDNPIHCRQFFLIPTNLFTTGTFTTPATLFTTGKSFYTGNSSHTENLLISAFLPYRQSSHTDMFPYRQILSAPTYYHSDNCIQHRQTHSAPANTFSTGKHIQHRQTYSAPALLPYRQVYSVPTNHSVLALLSYRQVDSVPTSSLHRRLLIQP